MKLKSIDIIIILTYLLSTVFIGLALQRMAQKSKSNYLLGGNKLPWYLLGLSNASGMYDISGTMWLVTILFVYGLKSIWLPWLWPVFNQVFLMVFLSTWLRKSNVTTGAEWIQTRFGENRDSRLSHAIVVVFALISCLGFLAYGFVGLGKFMMIFIPWETVAPFVPFNIPPEYVPHLYGFVFTMFAVFYAVLGGMTSIVWADVVQYSIMTLSALLIGFIAMKAVSGNTFNVPEGWHSPFFGWKLNDLNWTGIIDEVNNKIKSDGYSLFTIFFWMMVFKGILVSLAGPAPNYDMQKILSTRSPKDAAKMSGFVTVVLMPVRYFMVSGFAVLGLIYYDRLNLVVAEKVDFEQILPSAISEFVPAGFMGLLLAGLLAAFNGTFAGTLNAAQAYMVNDIYLKYIDKKPSGKKIKAVNYSTGFFIVLVSTVFGIFAQNVNSMMQWLVSALYGSYIVSNVLKWYWWRFNGSGYFWGMVTGIIPALIFSRIFPETLDLYYFPLILVISATGGILGTFLNSPTDENTLLSFYKTVNPWGFWRPIREKVVANDPGFVPNKNFKIDIFNILIGTIAQLGLVVIPIYIILQKKLPIMITSLITIGCAIILKKTWWNKLKD